MLNQFHKKLAVLKHEVHYKRENYAALSWACSPTIFKAKIELFAAENDVGTRPKARVLDASP